VVVSGSRRRLTDRHAERSGLDRFVGAVQTGESRALVMRGDLGPEVFFSVHGFAPTTTYDLVWDERRYPPKAILGTAYELATGQRLASGDFEGGKSGAVRVLGMLGFTVQERRPAR
jgi:hypothetical protein